MATNVAVMPQNRGDLMEAVIARGDVSKLTPEERARYYTQVCESIGLNPLTKPFEFIVLNGKLTFYARKDCTDQLRTIHNVSVVDLAESEREGVFIVTAKVVNGAGRTDMAKGAVNVAGLKGEALANALMKAETKAKRRATLSLCGLGVLDESEIEDIPAEAKGATVKTLPKKDAREIYSKLQAEINGATSVADLRQWGADARERIEVLPTDWQDHLRLRFQEKLVDLQQQSSRPVTPSKQDAPASDDIPAALDRRKPKPAEQRPEPETDPEAALKWVASALLAITDPNDLETIYNDKIAPYVDTLLPPDQEEALGLYRAREQELAP
jgi:hypothetical protein